ncbi:hypothetical protein SPHV1_2170060 [Novosphingobium sp. KN65.2]|nr:hypothetical protein SPHV1_2170060 [Novosphingobium sp. KN65.2]
MGTVSLALLAEIRMERSVCYRRPIGQSGHWPREKFELSIGSDLFSSHFMLLLRIANVVEWQREYEDRQASHDACGTGGPPGFRHGARSRSASLVHRANRSLRGYQGHLAA